jgi:uncharacterized membrane protein
VETEKNMGIVVSVIMLLGLCWLLPVPVIQARLLKSASSSANTVSALLLCGGLWNSVWFGLQHLAIFWGIAALISGILMALVSIIVFVQHGSGRLQEVEWLQRLYQLIQPLTLVLAVGLLLSFLLYAVTLVQLNLGMPILQ